MSDATPTPIADRTLVLERVIDASPEKVFEAWTNPALLKQWFAPKPWTTPHVDVDLRVGGRCNFTMRGPGGEENPNEGVYLEVVPGRRLTFTDAFTEGFVPKAGAPFMVATIELEPAPGGKTKYTATARHWTKETTEQHKQMGFHEGWGVCADQLNALVSGK